MKIVKLAIVGCGAFTYQTLVPMLRNLNMEIAAACDVDEQKLSRFQNFYHVGAVFTDYQEMIDKVMPDAVLCVTDAATHFAVARYCLEKGIRVFVEKVPCLTAGQAGELAKLQTNSKGFVAVGFNRRYVTAYKMAKDILSRPEYGKVSMYYSKFNASQYSSTEYFVFNHIIHHLDLAQFLLGELEEIGVYKQIIDDRHGSYIVNFKVKETKAVGTIQCACMLEEAYPMERLDLVSPGGNIVVDNLRRLEYYRTAPGRDKAGDIPLTNDSDALMWNVSNGYGIGAGIFSYLGMEEELREFIACVSEGKMPFNTIDTCVHTMELMEEVMRQVKA